tara:strand:- start:276 stop:1139 length:864 start_codon:yes stop_codon:yes gene_type:complete
MKSLKRLNKQMKTINDPEGGDGLVSYILEVIYDYLEMEPIRLVVEFGAHTGENGVFSDFLIKNGHKAILIEADKDQFEDLVEKYKDNSNVICINEHINFDGPNTLDQILSKTEVPKIFDVLLIDVDSTDYQIWESVNEYKPLLAVIEFNETFGPNLKRIHNIELNQWAARRNKNSVGEYIGSSAIAGSSLRSINELSKSKGYMLLTYTRNNAFFVKEELFHLFHLQEVDINTDFIKTTFNIPNRVLSSRDLIKKFLRFGFYETFLRQHIRDPKIIRIIKKWRNKWKI